MMNTAGPEKESGQNRAGDDSEGKAPLRKLKAVELRMGPAPSLTRDHPGIYGGLR